MWKSLVLLFALAPAAGGNLGPVSAVLPLEKLETLAGPAVHFRREAGATLLVFGARWCPPCETVLAQVRRQAAEFRPRGLQTLVVGVKARQSRAQFQAWLNGLGYQGAAAFDDTGQVQEKLKVDELPWFIVVGADGRILHSARQAPAADSLAGWLSL